MADEEEKATDDTSIKPVSSLRSKFESLGQEPPRSRSPYKGIWSPPTLDSRPAGSARASFDSQRPSPALGPSPGLGISTNDGSAAESKHYSGSTAHAGADSAVQIHALPPRVTVESPRSPPKPARIHPAAFKPVGAFQATSTALPSNGDSSPRNTTGAFDGLPGRRSPVLTVTPSSSWPRPLGGPSEVTHSPRTSISGPPPVNRAAKPSLPPSLSASSTPQLDAAGVDARSDKAISPFSTPPGTPPGDDDDVNAAANPRVPLPLGLPPPLLRTYTVPLKSDTDETGVPPQLPARTSIRVAQPYTRFQARSKSRERPIEGRIDVQRPVSRGPSPQGTARLSASHRSQEDVPRFAESSSLQHGSSGSQSDVMAPKGLLQPQAVQSKGTPPVVPAPRRSVDIRRSLDARPSLEEKLPPTLPERRERQFGAETKVERSDDVLLPATQDGPSAFPDTLRSNRRPPRFPRRPWELGTGYDTRLFTVCGEYCCSGGYLTRVWNVKTGESITTIEHSDGVKVTALTWKPMEDVTEEGQRLWLGTNMGDLMELDIPSKQIVHTRTQAHSRGEITGIFRQGSTLWSMDNDGKLLSWRPDSADGVASLNTAPQTFRVARGPSVVIVVGNTLWLAQGKDIRIYSLATSSEAGFDMLLRPISRTDAGDVTCAAKISSQPDKVYFGHSDGKVTVYNKKDQSHVGTFNISVYKVSAMSGVGNLLWAGYNDGTIYVYDTTTTPWTVKKNWKAHEGPVCGIVADQASIWKLDRFQVLTLGMDNVLRVWDGMLEEDWLEESMQRRDEEFCSFRHVTAAVFTWNAGASTPTALRVDRQDNNFFRDLLTSQRAPDIFVFGFQELVDLEDKKLTAKSFFKSKKKDSSEHEKMSHQYRAWRDHLVRSLEEFMPPTCPYTLLQTASLVGLFSCVFIKSSLRQNVTQVDRGELKRGMGGLHGNKGSIMLRMVLDDSSICWVNCHLAAGQTQTMNRNNDIAAILECDNMPAASSTTAWSGEQFTNGGDGTMILDHEMVILNGDLNYRIDAMTRDNVVRAVRENNLGKLLERDQLLLSRKRNPAFPLRNFREEAIAFAPTYKYNVGTDEYDTSEKRRSPAWCDRILYRAPARPDRLRCTAYRRWEVRASDHRPVTAAFDLRVKKVDAARRERVRASVVADLEVWRREVKVKVKLDYLVNVLGLEQNEAARLLQR